MKHVLCILLLTSFFSCATVAQNTGKRYVHTPDLGTIVMKVINKVNYIGYDSLYTIEISKPSPFYSDFFGIQAINKLSKEIIRKDFVPLHASVVSNDSNQLELRFKEGYTATFYINTNLNVAGQMIERDHIYFSDSTWQLFKANLDKFRALVKRLKLEKKYFITNPFYNNELATYNRIKANGPHAKVTTDSTGAAFNRSSNGLYIFPDPLHGDSAHFARLYTFLSTASYDWVGLEMLSQGWQKDINAFLTAAEGSEAYNAAKKRLVEFYAKGWKMKGKYNANEDGPWIKLFTMLRERKKKVYALESDDIQYVIFRFGETPFGGMVRNSLWAQRIPATGKGVVFGGSAHFTLAPPANFQDFAAAKNKLWQFFSLYEIVLKK